MVSAPKVTSSIDQAVVLQAVARRVARLLKEASAFSHALAQEADGSDERLILSFRERFIELGVLRAIGLSAAQLAAFLSAEQLVLIGSGIGVGTGLGVLTTKLFVPFFQVSDDLHPFTPPFDVRIAWGDIYKIYAVFGIMLIVAIAVLIFLLRRIKISQAIKLGETA